MATIVSIVGARPNLVKAAPVLRAIDRHRERLTQVVVHTGQHFSPVMSEVIMSDLGIRAPDVHLGIGGGTHAENTGRTLVALEPVLLDACPDVVLVYGDVDSTLAGALTAAKLNILVAHVEAGLRSFNRRMPEELNRIVTDHLADLLFCTEPRGVENLRREGISTEKIHFVGNTMIDSLCWSLERSSSSTLLDELDLERGTYGVVTLHRPENVDTPERLSAVLRVLDAAAAHVPLVWPLHPRTSNRLQAFGLSPGEGIRTLGALGYLDFLALTAGSCVVLTDSGGIQEETTALGIPCLTLREETERPVTVTEGTNTVVGIDLAKVEAALHRALDGQVRGKRPDLWDGRASDRVIDVLLGHIGDQFTRR